MIYVAIRLRTNAMLQALNEIKFFYNPNSCLLLETDPFSAVTAQNQNKDMRSKKKKKKKKISVMHSNDMDSQISLTLPVDFI